MLENTSTQTQTAWFFVSRLFILTGMVLFFASVSFVLGAWMNNVIFGVDAVSNPEIMSSFTDDPTVLNALKLLQVLLSVGGMMIPAFIFPKALEQSPAEFLQLNGKVTAFYIGCAVVLILACVPLVSWLIELNGRLQFPPAWAELEARLKASEEAATQMTNAFVKGTTTRDLLINLFIVAIVPAIAEELLFRGALQRFFVFCFRNVHVAVIISAAIFSAFHGQVYGFMPRWILGIILGYLFAYSGSVWPGVIAHFINNALSLLVVHFSLENTSLEIFNEDYHFPVYIVVLSGAACFSLIYFMYKKHITSATEHGI
jgi:membrane protease YdiL (CAAX protease family)